MSHGLHDIQTDILKLYIIIQDGFIGLSGLESAEIIQGLKTGRFSLRFHFLQVTHFPLSNCCLIDQTAQRE